MLIEDTFGFADPIDYEKYGPHIRYVKPDGSPDLSMRDSFRDRIRNDGSTAYPPDEGRYHLYLALGCPWAQRVAIVLHLLGLSEAITYSLVDDVRDGRGWAFRQRRGPDPINNFSTLRQAYLATNPGFEGRVSVPTLWDKKNHRVLNNSDDDIFWDILTQFVNSAKGGIDLYPTEHRDEIDALDREINDNVNMGVYAAGRATTQEDYDAAIAGVFGTLDKLESRLETRRYLLGSLITETDVRLWVTLARFDVVYNPFFRVNLRRLVDYKNLWAYARDLYTLPAFAVLADFDAFKLTYYRDFPKRNPSGLIPAGPIVNWREPQHREQLAHNPS